MKNAFFLASTNFPPVIFHQDGKTFYSYTARITINLFYIIKLEKSDNKYP